MSDPRMPYDPRPRLDEPNGWLYWLASAWFLAIPAAAGLFLVSLFVWCSIFGPVG